ncbi:signal transduction histidine kinase [Paenibacillus endophyticus]|uniref:histidine kinase n=1 Tax=Paenibacillus endophyticus TaxID=1294268 RepID=A0A7W5CAK8_9BACL|nr:ATP-binding protein [Paenibacillus endophyticus]MBB3153184.1 signal transduction histidine kinase [Paenibacillus endophyticus]
MIKNDMITEAHKQCRLRGLNPDELPIYTEWLSSEALASQQNHYKDIIEVISVFVDKFLSSVADDPFFAAITDHQGHILEFRGNPAIISTARELGITEGVRFCEELGPNAIDMALRINSPVELKGEDHYHRVLHQLACYTAPFHLESDGQLLGTLSIMTDTRSAHPHLLALLCTIVDSIERELLLRKHNTQLHILNQVLLETNYYGVIITDALGTILEINDYSAVILNNASNEKRNCIGEKVFDLRIIGPYFERFILHGETCVGIEVSVKIEDEHHFYMLDVVPIYDKENMLIRVVGSLRDITEMKVAEELLRNTEKLGFAGQLAVSIAHEIRNPMTTVKGMLQLSSKTTNPHYYNVMMSELDRMNAIVGEFLILGRPQALQYKEEQCADILQEVLSVFEMQFEMNGIIIRTEYKEMAIIRCDRDQVKQVFLNILKNAMEALPFGGEVSIQLDMVDSYQRILFKDNGVGMTDEVKRRIGQPFHTTRRDGNGLGMMIVDKIISSHDGRLVVSSELGTGTTVEIWLPKTNE